MLLPRPLSLLAAALALSPFLAHARDTKCPELMERLASRPAPELLKAARDPEAEAAFLQGEFPSAINRLRRELMPRVAKEEELAQELARPLLERGLAGYPGPAESLLALFILGKSRKDLFVEAARAVMQKPAPWAKNPAYSPEKIAAVKNQLASRLIGQLSEADPAQVPEIAEIIARAPWVRAQFARHVNAARSLLNAITNHETLGAPSAEALRAFDALAASWIRTRLAFAEARVGATAASGEQEMDWAFSRVLAKEMQQRLQSSNPARASHYARISAKLDASPHAAEYRASPRVVDLLLEFGI